MKLPVPFIQLPLLFDAGALRREIAAFDEGMWTAHPTGMPGNSGGRPSPGASVNTVKPASPHTKPSCQEIASSPSPLWMANREARMSAKPIAVSTLAPAV